MKKAVKLLGITLFLGLGLSNLNAQKRGSGSYYNTGIGLLVDVGDGSTAVGPHVKHFFSRNHAGEFAVLFGSGATHLNAMYHYQSAFGGNARGLAWYLGIGPGLSFVKGGSTVFSIAPVAGIDFKIPGAPLDLFFDWRPRAWFYSGNSDFTAARFGLGVRVTF